jgi:lipoprotein-anchoring transpeptidase ErfK/SrfK
MGLRLAVWALCLPAIFAATFPAAAEQGRPSPPAFQVLGGLDEAEATPVSFNTFEDSLPEQLRSRTIAFRSRLSPGSILVRTGERRLYYILPGGQAIMYNVGVGRDGFTWSGTNAVSRKAEWPDWRPPPEMIARERNRGHDLPDFMPGGPDNPLGARAIYIGDTEFRIHGTTQPWSIGQAVSSGCIRMMNEEVIDLYDRVHIGATVVVED